MSPTQIKIKGVSYILPRSRRKRIKILNRGLSSQIQLLKHLYFKCEGCPYCNIEIKNLFIEGRDEP